MQYYSNHYKPDGVFNEISDHSQTRTVQKYLNNIGRLNVYGNMIDNYLKNIFMNDITNCHRQAMAHHEDLCCDPSKWKKKLYHMDFFMTEIEKKEEENKSRSSAKNRGLEK